MIATEQIQTMRVPYAYLDSEFADPSAIMSDIAALVRTGDFTLGYPVREFEDRVRAFTGVGHAVGMASGTDALTLALVALGVGHGDEVITATNSFVASAGAIAMAGATPVLVDVRDDYLIDPEAVERAVTQRTKAIIPVHLTGSIADMPAIMAIARHHGLFVVEDAAQAMGATLYGQHAGSWGDVACVSLHPLKMLNVWGDGGICLTQFAHLDERLRLLRNHGLASRDDAVMFGANGRLSSLQAVVANRVILGLPQTLERRRAAAAYLDKALAALYPAVRLPVIQQGSEPSYATYIIRAERRDELQAYLIEHGVDAKIHYPKPIHLQTVGHRLGYRHGEMPEAERQAAEILTLPLNEYLTSDQLAYMVEQIRAFYAGGGA